MKPKPSPTEKPKVYAYPDYHPFAIFEGNYKSQIDWTNLTLKQKTELASEQTQSTEDRAADIVAFTKISVKAFTQRKRELLALAEKRKKWNSDV